MLHRRDDGDIAVRRADAQR